MTDKLNQEIKIKAKQVTEDLINFMQDLDTENNYQIKELEKDIEYYKSRIEELEKQIEKLAKQKEIIKNNYDNMIIDYDMTLESKNDTIEHAKEIIGEYSKWECEYCDYKRNPDYVTMHCSQCQKYPLHKKAKAFIDEQNNCKQDYIAEAIELAMDECPYDNADEVEPIVEEIEDGEE